MEESIFFLKTEPPASGAVPATWRDCRRPLGGVAGAAQKVSPSSGEKGMNYSLILKIED